MASPLARGGGGGGSGGLSPVPRRRSSAAAGGRPGGVGPGGPAADGEGCILLLTSPSFGRQAVGPPPHPLLPVGRGGGGGGSAGTGGGGSGQWLAVSGLRGPAAPYGWGGWGVLPGFGNPALLGGCPAALVLLHPLAPLAWVGGAQLSPASLLAEGWGCGGGGFCQR